MTGDNTVRLVLVRHGEAQRHAARDELRPLTEHGKTEAAATGARLLALSTELALPPPKVYASPYLRARETAAIIAGCLGVAPPDVVPGITPDDDPRRALRVIDALCVPAVTPVVVTHMPLIGGLLSWLVEGDLRHAPGVATAGGAILAGAMPAAGLMRVLAPFAPD